jgi:chloramphenicol 3-O phosphotransferase
MMERGKIIFLNGVSSCGKTTLGWKLQELAKSHYYLISQDQFAEMWPAPFWFQNPEKEFNHTMSMMYKTIAMFASSGENMIIDHVLLNNERLKSDNGEGTLQDFKKQLADFKIVYVHVTCPIDELRIREKERGDREVGNAEKQLLYLDPQEGYDITVDTFNTSIDECARKILKLIE